MNNKYKIILVLSLSVVMVWYFKIRQIGPEKKFSNFKSYQTEMISTSIATTPIIKHEDKFAPKIELVNNKKERLRIIATKSFSENPVVKQLDQKIAGWSWSPNVFVIDNSKYKGAKENIIGSHDGYLVIKDSNKPEGALNLVYNEIEKRLGIYMNKIVILHERSSEFEEKLNHLGMNNVDYVSGVYFIESKLFSEAIVTISKLQSATKATKVDLDVNYATQRPN